MALENSVGNSIGKRRWKTALGNSVVKLALEKWHWKTALEERIGKERQ
jgi:hypothetical protein